MRKPTRKTAPRKRLRPAKKRERKTRPRPVAKKKARKRGAPSKLTPEIRQAIEAFVQEGLSPSRAALLAGVSPQAVSDWRDKFPEFSEGLDRARARGIQERITAVRLGMNAAGMPDWKAHAWLLERMAPEEFGKKPEVQVTTQTTATASAVATGLVMSEADLEALRARRRAALGKVEPAGKQRGNA